MFLSPANALAPLRPDLGEFSRAAVLPEPHVADAGRISELTALRHARYAPLAAALGEIALRRLQPRSRGLARAVITVGDGLHHDMAAQFGHQLRRSGPRLVNPIMFPNILPSSCAVLLGALYEAHVCSIALEGTAAFHQALDLARMLLYSGTADEILLFGCKLEHGAPRIALGFLVSLVRLSGLSLELDSLGHLSGGSLQDAAEMLVANLEL